MVQVVEYLDGSLVYYYHGRRCSQRYLWKFVTPSLRFIIEVGLQ